ncbi:MAG: bifunctional DNA-formamidopyrimidine glycosylase/DNA-(apurinic or apyrimidinic site) lyase [Rhodocyclaceae bacterium]|nr:bifunctional DNA-formamidopyrimidine glycosylase/DNA-(apurinic or apyrimidinic site) lyase [Rhodocyclaceae bacterium]
MPELPEVEVTRLGIAPAVTGWRATGAVTRVGGLRYPLPDDLGRRLAGQVLREVRRRGKYLLLHFDEGRLLLHLGMSGSLRLLPAGTPAARHDHVDLLFGKVLLRLTDPRRFGSLLWLPPEPAGHPLLDVLGIEPLEAAFTGRWLHAALRGRRGPVKPAIMDSHLVVGIGNIYASESLFRAGIDPRRAAGRISGQRCDRLADAVRATLNEAIAAGGSSLKDFIGSDGGKGWFQQSHFVYGRAGEPCRACGGPVRQVRQAGRATFFCPRCQR